MTCISMILAGCLGGGGGGKAELGGGRRSDVNRPPVISGSPATLTLPDLGYSFRPKTSDADGDRLSFSITNKPAWAYFDPQTGRLYGTPHAGYVGIYQRIEISVSDGKARDSLPAFDLEVSQTADGSVTLSWLPPTENANGSPLTDLKGYRIYCGTSRDRLNRVKVINNPGITSYVVENLSPATWYFAMSSVSKRGKESARSAVVSKEVG